MHVDAIRRHIDRDPFRPFRLHLSDGNVRVIADPDLVFVTRHTVMVGNRRAGEVIPDYADYYDPIHITQVETMLEPPVEPPAEPQA